MKIIIIYSGKGGVGKTTTTANIAKILSSQRKKVFILDADVNTPSMPVIFPEPTIGNYLKVASLGYLTNKSIYVTDSSIRSYISKSINQINGWKPDYVLIDTPPSITDVHINLLDKIKPSGLIIVTQPNILSITDINRTALFFQEKKTPIIGIIENMCTDDNVQKYSWNVLGSVPFEKNFDFKKVFSENKKIYMGIVNSIKNVDSVILENKKRALYDETITVDDILSLPFENRNSLKFFNVSTWEYVRELLSESEFKAMQGMAPDQFLVECTTEKIERMLKAFESDEQSMFMITRAPNTAIKLIPGEIGQGSLTVATSYYGVPRIKYSTLQGEVVLFPYEIMPISTEDLISYQGDGYVATKDGRYLPSKKDVYELAACFGSRVGLYQGWEKNYDNILNGNLTPVEDTPFASDIVNVQNNKIKRFSKKGQRTIADFGDHYGI